MLINLLELERLKSQTNFRPTRNQKQYYCNKRIEYVLMTSRPPCWRSKQYRVGHIGGVYKSSGN